MKRIIVLFFIFVLNFGGFAQSPFPYDLNRPAKRIILPEILNEVSGLTDMDLQTVACVQDEIGTIFIYNLVTEKIMAEEKFKKHGDFEGLAYTGESIYVLRSDGKLTEWEGFSAGGHSGNITEYKLSLATSDNEGLAYDRFNNRLLIAGKDKPKGKKNKNDRYVYEFDLSVKKLNETPVYILNLDVLEEYVEEHNINLYDEKKHFDFSPSGLAVHPQSRNIYIVSARNHLLVVINQEGDVLRMDALKPDLFPQAEGITFLEDGTMIITNEAAGSVPTMLIYQGH